MSTRSEHPAKLRIASYNVRKCIGLDRRRVPERVLDAISDVGADVIAIQEADKRLGERPTSIPLKTIDTHTDFEPVRLAHNDVSLGWHGNAVLVRKGMQVTNRERLHLPYFEPRGAALVELSHKDRPLRVIGVHLGLMRRHREAQLAAIAAEVAKRPHMPTIILGDFNEWSRKRGMEALEKDFTIHIPGSSYHTARPVAPLDRIAMSRDLELHDAGVHEKGLALTASDHLPIWADIELGEAPVPGLVSA